MKKETEIITKGRYPFLYGGSVNTPIFSTSTVLYPTREAYLKAERGEAYFEESKMGDTLDFSYGTGGTPTTYALQEALRDIENGDACAITSSGLSAITNTLHSLLKSGDHILMVDTVYGPTRRYCNLELKSFGIEVEYYNPRINSNIVDLIKENTKVIFMESPGSLTFEVQNVAAITEIAKEKGIYTILDNSWATPLYFNPIDYGVDIVIHAVTKFIGGHSDLLVGAIIVKGEELSKKILKGVRNLGSTPNPFSCYLALRGLRSLSARMEKHQRTSEYIIPKIKNHQKIAEILYPASNDSPDYELWKSQFSGAASLFSVVLDKKYSDEQLSAMMNNFSIFGIGASWGGFESLVLDFNPKSIRTAVKWKDDRSCIRFYLGLENEKDLLEDLLNGLERL